MIPQAEQYPFVETNPQVGAASLLPLLPLTLALGERALSGMGLLDTAAAVNVLPYRIVQQRGAVWE